MYSRLKSSLLNHFQKGNGAGANGVVNLNGMSKEEKKRLRHSLAECHLNDASSSSASSSSCAMMTYEDSAHHAAVRRSHAPLAPAEEYLDESTTSSGTCYSDFLASSFSSASCSQFDQNNDYYEDPHDPIVMMPAASAAFSWNVQYVGSFPISSATDSSLGRRIDGFQSAAPHQNVELSVSVLGVRISCEKTNLMSHSLRRVTDVASRPASNKVGYVATEPIGRTYRRLCHVFYCQTGKEAEEIENVLHNANRSEVLAPRHLIDHNTLPQQQQQQQHQRLHQQQTTSSSSMLIHGSASTSTGTGNHVAPATASSSSSATSTMTEKRSASTVFLNRFLGKKGSQTVDETGQCKRKRRPVSAVFSSAIHRLSNSTSSVNPKRMTTIEPTSTIPASKEHFLQLQKQMRCSSPVPEEPRPSPSSQLHHFGASSPTATTTSTSSVTSTTSTTSSTSSNGTSSSTATSPVPPLPQNSLTFDDKLGEWIYPIDAAITTQLDNCSYFVGMPTRDSLAYNLLSQPEGAFVIRYSESKTKCLALSMRVPVTHNPGGISHYLIIRNEHGFRLKLSATKKPFPTLQMMLTHHSVLEGHLPCTLHFVQWQKTNFKQLPALMTPTVERTPRTFNRHSTALTKIDENRNLTTSTPTSSVYRPSGRCGGEELMTTPKHRRSRHELNAIRRSHFFDDRHIVL